MSKKIDDFIGRKFGDKSQLTVLEWDGERRNGAKYYKVKCDICSLDAKLYGTGVFGSFKSSLLKGQVPCGCGGGVRLDKEQLGILIKRECDKGTTTFVGFCGEWKGVFTNFSQECNICGHLWHTGSKSNLSAGRGCPECQRLSLIKPDEVMISSFLVSGSFVAGTSFKRSVTRQRHWEYTCPVCSNDEYVKAGLCEGVFSSSDSSLQRGSLACRCSVKYNWTQSQREYQISKILEQEKLSAVFIGWKEGHQGSASKVLLDCKVHGVWDVSVNSFIDMGSRCPDCAESGYRKSKPGNLYVMVSKNITKVGITNRSVKSRLNDINWRLPSSVEEPFKVLFHEHFTDGSTPRSVETNLKKMLNSAYSPMTEKFDGYTECFFDVDREQLLNLIQDEIALAA